MITKKELEGLYIDDHMTIKQVALKLNVSAYFVKKNLLRYGICVRKKGYGHNVVKKIMLSHDQYHFFDGLMAGDGSICRRKSLRGRRTRGNDFVSCGFKHKEFAEYIVGYLDLGLR